MKPYYQDKWVTIYNGDCMAATWPSVGAVLTDPPYGITSNKWDVMFDFCAFWKAIASACSGPIIVCASQPFSSRLVCSNLPWFRHEWIWWKNQGSNFANTVREPMKEHEHVLVFSEHTGWPYHKQMQPRTPGGSARAKYAVKFETSSENYREFGARGAKPISELRVPSSVQQFKREIGLHPTQKPLSLMRYMVRTYCNNSILDPYAGSGTTLLAAKIEGVKAVGFEINEKYCEVAASRCSKEMPNLHIACKRIRNRAKQGCGAMKRSTHNTPLYKSLRPSHRGTRCSQFARDHFVSGTERR